MKGKVMKLLIAILMVSQVSFAKGKKGDYEVIGQPLSKVLVPFLKKPLAKGAELRIVENKLIVEGAYPDGNCVQTMEFDSKGIIRSFKEAGTSTQYCKPN